MENIPAESINLDPNNLNANYPQNISEPVDKRPFYIWLMVILANIGTYLTIVIMEVYDGGRPVFISLLAPAFGYSIIIVFSLFVSIIPIWLSGTKFRRRNYFGFGIPIILLLPIPYFIWHAYTCTGKFCNLFYMIVVQTLVILAVIFSLIYLIGVFFRKWNIKFSLFLVWLESILLIGAIIFLGYYAYSDFRLAANITVNSSQPVLETMEVCNSLPESRMRDCWSNVFRSELLKDNVCRFVSKEYYSGCFFNLVGYVSVSAMDSIAKAAENKEQTDAICKNIIEETIQKYGFTGPDIFYFKYGKDGYNGSGMNGFGVMGTALAVITSCKSTKEVQPFKDLYFAKFGRCDKVEDLQTKQVCLDGSGKNYSTNTEGEKTLFYYTSRMMYDPYFEDTNY